MTRIDLLCTCGSSAHIQTDQLLDAQAERTAWDLLHAGCLPSISDDEIARKGAK